MIVVNMWFIKHSNGLFHYGLDYAAALGDAVREIWVGNDALAQAVRRRLPEVHVVTRTASALVAGVAQVRRRGDLMFTPSSHPLAGLRRQVVVVHDSFPFTGRVGRTKLALFRLGLVLSGGAAAYINRADGKRFLQYCGLNEARTRYLPNRIAALPSDRAGGVRTLRQPIVVGLFGSDSPKKNYDALFAAFAATASQAPIVWRLYGHANAYTERLRAAHPGLAIEVIVSDTMDMDAFIGAIDVAVSVAEGEGFARPVALALMQGVPTLLLDTPVFREFYGGSARLFGTPAALVDALAALHPGMELKRPTLVTANALRRDFESGVDWLRAR